MNEAVHCLFGIAYVLYFVSGIGYVANLLARGASRWRAALAAGALGFAVHTAVLALLGLEHHRAPFTSFFESASFLAWSIVLVYLAVDRGGRLPTLGAVALPLAFLVIFFASTLPPNGADPLISRNHSLKIHIAMSLLGYASLGLAFCTALIYLLQERRLKAKRFVKGAQLLSLEDADVLANRLAAVGFSLLTMGLITGFIFASREWKGFWLIDPKVITSLAAWSVYALYLYMRDVRGWRGRRTMLLLIAGFAAVVAGYVGVSTANVGRHAFRPRLFGGSAPVRAVMPSSAAQPLPWRGCDRV
ncbi:MAG: cytochrome C assembly family protein [Armatimonadota bacterium]